MKPNYKLPYYMKKPKPKASPVAKADIVDKLIELAFRKRVA